MGMNTSIHVGRGRDRNHVRSTDRPCRTRWRRRRRRRSDRAQSNAAFVYMEAGDGGFYVLEYEQQCKTAIDFTRR